MAERRDDEPDWVGKLFLIILGAILFIIIAYLCSHSCQAGFTWSNTKNCCVDALDNCYVVTPPASPPSACDNDGTCDAGETCSTCLSDCGACPVIPVSCVPNFASCGPATSCCDGTATCTGSPSICKSSSCTYDAYPCTSDSECCSSGNCASGNCCPPGATWNPIDVCCEIGGACVCVGRTGDCSVYECCSPLACVGPGIPHCCDSGEEWDPILSRRANLAESFGGEWFCDGNPVCSTWLCNGGTQNPFPSCSCNCTSVTCIDPLLPILDTADCSCDPISCSPVCLNGGIPDVSTCSCDCTYLLCPAPDTTLTLLGSYTHLEPISSGLYLLDVKTFAVPPDSRSGELRIPAGPTGYIDDSGWITLNGKVIYYYPPPACGSAYTAVRIPIVLNPGVPNTLEIFAKDVCTGSVGYKNVEVYGRGTVPPTSSDCACSCAGITCPSGIPLANTCTCPCPAIDCNGGTQTIDPPCNCDCSLVTCPAGMIKDPYNCKCIADCATTCLNGGIQNPFPACTCDCTGITCLDPDSTVVNFNPSAIVDSPYYSKTFQTTFTTPPGATNARLAYASIRYCGNVSINGFVLPIRDMCTGTASDCTARDPTEDILVQGYLKPEGMSNVLVVNATNKCSLFEWTRTVSASIKINIGKIGPTTRADCGCDCTGATCATPNPDCSCTICGDTVCNGAEDCSTCPGDCGACAPTCGDTVCNGIETCSTCPGDCGACVCTAPFTPPLCLNGGTRAAYPGCGCDCTSVTCIDPLLPILDTADCSCDPIPCTPSTVVLSSAQEDPANGYIHAYEFAVTPSPPSGTFLAGASLNVTYLSCWQTRVVNSNYPGTGLAGGILVPGSTVPCVTNLPHTVTDVNLLPYLIPNQNNVIHIDTANPGGTTTSYTATVTLAYACPT